MSDFTLDINVVHFLNYERVTLGINVVHFYRQYN